MNEGCDMDRGTDGRTVTATQQRKMLTNQLKGVECINVQKHKNACDQVAPEMEREKYHLTFPMRKKIRKI